TGLSFLNILWDDVLSANRDPQELALFLQENVEKDIVIETWERELGVLTEHRYHFPDQSLLARTHAANYRGGPRDYALGADYFQKHQPSYLIIGSYAKLSHLYDVKFLAEHSDLIATIGNGEKRYEVYKLELSSMSTHSETDKNNQEPD
ncbi:hypothetical protein ACFLXQ_04530, partial [Chloroflexota bacterium]